MSEKISLLSDGELDAVSSSQLLDALTASDLKRWRNYHLIGQAARGESIAHGRDLSINIANAIAREPTVFMPAAMDERSRRDSAKAAPYDIWKPVSFFALAASLVLVAVVTLNPLNNTVNPGLTEVAEVNQTGNQSAGNGDIQQALFSAEFDEMLVGHGEFTTSAALNGLLSYSKLVSNQALE